MIREFKKEDLKTLVDIGNRAWQGIYDMFYDLYGEDLFNVLVPDRMTEKGAQVERSCLAHPDWVYVCEEDGRIVGFVTFNLDFEKKVGEIGNNAVDPECGLKGIGQQMYAACFERFKREGMLYAKVSTGMDHGHSRARKAYERAGFNISHQNIRYFKKL